MLFHRSFWLSAVALAAFAMAGPAVAGPYSMTGQWHQNRGPLVDIPLNGGAAICFPRGVGACIGNKLTPKGGLNPAGFIEVLGGVPGSGTVMQKGIAPKTLTIPTNVFGQAKGKQQAPVVIVPTVIQLATTFTLAAPRAARTKGMTTGGMTAPAGTRVLKKRTAGAFPSPDGRLAANFAWCPGVGGPACATPGMGVYNGLVKYTAGKNTFGGTMTLLLSGTGTVGIKLGAAVGFNLIMGAGSQAPGRGYATTDTAALPGGAIHSTYMLASLTTSGTMMTAMTTMCTNTPLASPAPAGCSIITAVGAVTGMLPNDTNLNYGFPWTTGTVVAQNVQTNLGQPGTSTLTGMGTDSRNGLGIGNITLVAGGTSHRQVSGQDFAALDLVEMTISGGVPALSGRGLAAGAALLLLAGGYAFRRRF